MSNGKLVKIGVMAAILVMSVSCFSHSLAAGGYIVFAIAVHDGQDFRHGSGYGRTVEEAKREALESCGSGCRVVTWARGPFRECAALAVSSDGAWGSGGSEAQALNQCRQRGSDCYIQYHECPSRD